MSVTEEFRSLLSSLADCSEELCELIKADQLPSFQQKLGRRQELSELIQQLVGQAENREALENLDDETQKLSERVFKVDQELISLLELKVRKLQGQQDRRNWQLMRQIKWDGE